MALTNFVDFTPQLSILRNRDDETFDRSDECREGKDTSSGVLLSCPVSVFENRVEDTTNTERGLDDVRNEFAH